MSEPVEVKPLPEEHALLVDPGSEMPLLSELTESGAAPVQQGAGWCMVRGLSLEQRQLLAFSRQLLPHALRCQEASINAWARRIVSSVLAYLPVGPWRLHLAPLYGEGKAGQQRCRLIGDAVRELLQKRRRAMVASMGKEESPFLEEESLVQLVLLSPEEGLLSVAPAPLPAQQRQLIWPQMMGQVPVAVDKAAPSRAFAKLVEAETRLGCRIQPGQSCVDLGASPGSWSYVALQRGARVTAIDRSPLREDLMKNPRLHFLQADAFQYRPEHPVDWLICDIIAEPDKLADLLLSWLKGGHAKRFVFTIKFRGDGGYHHLNRLKEELPSLCSMACLIRLCSNKNEVSAFGVL
jgi:23S rRNA (cytidine2498-2'-O)-methyltransferase